MNQDKKHHFQDRNIDIVWRITQDLPQDNQIQHQPQDNQIQHQQISYEYIPVQQGQDIGMGPGIGGIVRISNGQEFMAYPNEGQLSILVDNQNNQWVPLEQKLAEFQQQIPQQTPQQIPQQNQTNNELSLYVEVRDYNNFNEYRGHITASDYLSQTQGLGEELEDLYLDIEKHILSIFDKNSSVYLNMTHKDTQLEFKLQMAKGKKLIDFFIPIKLTLVEQNKEDREKLKKEMEINKQNKRLEKMEENVNQLQQSLTDHSQGIGYIQQELGNQKTELFNKIQQVEQNLQQQLTGHGQGIGYISQELGNQKGELFNKISQVEQNLQQQCQQLIQQQQNQFNKVSINHMKQVKEQDYIYITIQKLKGQFEFELLINDDDIEFQVGIIADDDLDNIEKKNKSYYVVLPDGKFTRGTTEFGNFFTYKLQLEDKLGLRVDTVKHIFQLVINDYPFPPVKISESIEEFSFVIKSSEEINTFAGNPNQS